jgi:hypothetical protein
LTNLREVAFRQFGHLATIADFAGEQHIPITVAEFDKSVHQLNALFDIRVSPGFRTAAIERPLSGSLLLLSLVLVVIAVLPSIRKSRDEVFVGGD